MDPADFGEGVGRDSAFTADDVARVAADLAEGGTWTPPAGALDLAPGLKWRPDLVSIDGAAILHIHLDSRLRSYVAARMDAAAANGLAVHVALPEEQLWNRDVLRALSASAANVVVLREGAAPEPSVPLLRALADAQISVPVELRRVLARDGWAACRREGLSAHQKGRTLEALLGFLLSQVGDFKVVEYNLRTDTEELDLVVQLSRIDGLRCWVSPGQPFIIIEAKNWTSKVGQAEISQLYTKVVTKRKTVRLAMLVCANGYTDDADRQVLKTSLGEEVLVLLGPSEIERWIEEGEDYLETRVRHAMLR